MQKQIFTPFAILLLLVHPATHAEQVDHPCTLQTRSNGTYAYCRARQLTSVPTSLPDNLVGLDLSRNKLTAIANLSFVQFPNLRTLDLGFNKIVQIETDAFDGLNSLEVLNLAYNNISIVTREDKDKEDTAYGSSSNTTVLRSVLVDGRDQSVPNVSTQQEVLRHNSLARERLAHNNTRRGLFRALSNLRALDLSHNWIHNVHVHMFGGLGSLQHLNLSGNILESIDDDCFDDLKELATLDISHNKIQSLSEQALSGLDSLQTLVLNDNSLGYDNASLPDDVFQPVATTLTCLALAHNQMRDDSRLRENTLSKLTSLEYLSTDASYRTQFGAGFRTMTVLSTLVIEGHHFCKLPRLTNDTFVNLKPTNLTTLILSNCKDLFCLQPCAFCHLDHLTHLSLRGSEMVGVPQALRSLYATVGKNISVIDFSGIARGRRWQGRKGTALDPSVTEYLLQTCVSTLILSNNDIFAIRPHSLVRPGALFNRCLRSIDLSRNYIFSAGLIGYFSFFRLSTHLRSFHIQEQMFYSITEAENVLHLTYEGKSADSFYGLHLAFHLPPELEVLNMSATCYQVGPLPEAINFTEPNNLKVWDMSYVQIQNCWFMFYGLHNLESLNMSRNSCQGLQPSFFDFLPSLRELSLQNSNVARFFLPKHSSRVFRNLPLLQRLDLSSNDLEFPLTELLEVQHDLRELRLSGNHFAHVPLKLDQHHNLSVLDLSHNVITHLEAEDRHAIDRLALSRAQPFFLHLHGNPLACTCDTLLFIRWLSETRALLDQGGNYTCVSDDGSLQSTLAVIGNVDFVWRRCVGTRWLLGSLLGLLSLLSFLGSAWAVSVNATRLRFWFTVFRKIRMPRRQSFEKDAYLVYCDADTELVCVRLKHALQEERGVRLLIKDLPRDHAETSWWLLPGDNQAEKMLEHMDLCWKVVLVLTSGFTRDPMAGFMIRAALQSISDTMPHRVILLCVGVRHVPALASLRPLLETVPERQVFFVPSGAGDSHPVWDSVAEVISGHHF
ncbi:toll-like receptor 3 [Littorina saxatilis]|uniref:TIR domain-containing protein n=1 Tax=Littorina saxatilis TaxID=31220 RepID=A0AAN9BZP3_9CAEN